MNLYVPLSLCLLLSTVSVGAAQSKEGAVLSPQAIVVNPVPAYEVEVFVDRDSSGESTPSYAVGEAIRIGVRVTEDAYVYLFNVRTDGGVNQILPNNYDAVGQDNFVRGGQTKYFPPEGAAYAFQASAPEGLDKLIAVASETQLDTSALASFTNDPNFASSALEEEEFASALSIIVTPLPQDDWVSDTALFYVGSAVTAAPRYGTMSVTSEPAGARVFVDDTFVGYTPLRYGTTSGNHVVNVELDGYDGYEATIAVTGGQTRDVQAGLSQQQRLGQAGFESNPNSAQVYVDGQLIGTTPTDTVNLSEGEHQARFVLPGFDETTMSFTVSAGSYQVVSGELRSQQGILELTGNVGGAIVFIDGQRVGTIPNGTGRLTFEQLPPGTHEITVTAPGFSTFVGEFEILAGQPSSLNVSQSRR